MYVATTGNFPGPFHFSHHLVVEVRPAPSLAWMVLKLMANELQQ